VGIKNKEKQNERMIALTREERALGFNPYIGSNHKRFLFDLGVQARDIFRQFDPEILDLECFEFSNGR
jgi:hypothetical protein